MKARSPFLRRTILVPVGVVVALVLVLAALNPSQMARDLVVRQATRALGRPVTVESVRTSFLPGLRVRLSGLAIPEAADVPLARNTPALACSL